MASGPFLPTLPRKAVILPWKLPHYDPSNSKFSLPGAHPTNISYIGHTYPIDVPMLIWLGYLWDIYGTSMGHLWDILPLAWKLAGPWWRFYGNKFVDRQFLLFIE
jgi:hypothetical protein